MELVTGMWPLEKLLAPPPGHGVTAWYLNSGGLAWRLRLLAHLADLMAELHGRGLVWLIDADNLHYEDQVAA